MNFSISSLFAGLIFSVIGLYVFRVGKRETNITLIVLGLVLMLYTYFTKSAAQDWLIGAALCGISYYFKV